MATQSTNSLKMPLWTIIPSLLLFLLPPAMAFGRDHAASTIKNPPQAARIAMITWRGVTDAEKGFMEGLQGRAVTTVIAPYHADQDIHRLDRILSSIGRHPVDLIYVFGTTATQSVLKKFTSIPVVFNIVSQPVASGIIADWDHSGNNATGCSNLVPMENQLKTLKKVINYKRLGIIYNPREANSVIQRNLAAELQNPMDFQLIDFKISNPGQMPRIMSGLKGRVDAVYLPADSRMISLGNKLAEWINRFKIPSLAATESMVTEHGLLLGLQPSYRQLGLLAAEKTVRILEGEEPGGIPTSHLNFFNMTVNLATARRIGAQLPISILMMADTIVR